MFLNKKFFWIVSVLSILGLNSSAIEISNLSGSEQIFYQKHLQFIQQIEPDDEVGVHLLDPSLAPIYAISIYLYTVDGDVVVNQWLSKKTAVDGFTPEQASAFVDVLSKALDQLPAQKGISYRGANLHSLACQVGSISKFPEFLSTSENKNVAYGFMNWGGKYPVTYIFKSLSGKKIRQFSNVPGESEVLFNHGTRFKVVKCPYAKKVKLDESGKATTVYFMNLEEVP